MLILQPIAVRFATTIQEHHPSIFDIKPVPRCFELGRNERDASSHLSRQHGMQAMVGTSTGVSARRAQGAHMAPCAKKANGDNLTPASLSAIVLTVGAYYVSTFKSF